LNKLDLALPNGYVRRDRRLLWRHQNPSRVSSLPPVMPSVCSTSGGLTASEVWRTTAPRRREVFSSLFRLFSRVFFGMVRRQLHPINRIRSFLPYPCYAGVSSAGGGLMESCVRWISWDLVGFYICWCGFRSLSSDLRCHHW
jgi:hypothetical protein